MRNIQALRCALVIFALLTQVAAILWDLDFESEHKAKGKIPQYEEKAKVFKETKSILHKRINEMARYTTIPKRLQQADFLVELGGADKSWTAAEKKVKRIQGWRIHVAQLYVESSHVVEADHPDSVFIHTPPEHASAAQHKYFARLDNNHNMYVYDGFFAISDMEERVERFVFALFLAYAEVKDCPEASAECAMAYAKLSHKFRENAAPQPSQSEKSTGVKGAALAQRTSTTSRYSGMAIKDKPKARQKRVRDRDAEENAPVLKKLRSHSVAARLGNDERGEGEPSADASAGENDGGAGSGEPGAVGVRRGGDNDMPMVASSSLTSLRFGDVPRSVPTPLAPQSISPLNTSTLNSQQLESPDIDDDDEAWIDEILQLNGYAPTPHWHTSFHDANHWEMVLTTPVIQSEWDALDRQSALAGQVPVPMQTYDTDHESDAINFVSQHAHSTVDDVKEAELALPVLTSQVL
ncbi:hypothetical protein CVT24_000816 [Panaeolus cyanescens]|uniref:Uncharacterized protein n=1 Tax=Panaeolus cyanescens TaxID=181874 RepID=A0A409YCV4_9AGAR|nr:hypothetical protein CVT24_000816 [Panaeolus cyanescens]